MKSPSTQVHNQGSGARKVDSHQEVKNMTDNYTTNLKYEQSPTNIDVRILK